MRLVALTSIAFTATLSLIPADARAQTQDCRWTAAGLECFTSLPGRSGGGGPAPEPPPGPSPNRQTANLAQGSGPSTSRLQWQNSSGGVCLPDESLPAQYGTTVVPMLVDTQTGAIVERRPDLAYCQGPSAAGVPTRAAPPPPPPPPPPTTGEVAAAMADFLIIDSQLNPRPEFSGLTGLNTWVWCADPGEIVVSAAIRGYRVEGHASVTQLNWVIDGVGDGGSWTRSECGSEEHPAVTWMPETMGAYSVALSATWGGYWTASLNGANLGSYDLGTVTVEQETIDYPVDEYRGVLIG